MWKILVPLATGDTTGQVQIDDDATNLTTSNDDISVTARLNKIYADAHGWDFAFEVNGCTKEYLLNGKVMGSESNIDEFILAEATSYSITFLWSISYPTGK